MWLIYLYLFIAGLFIGSFYNVVDIRLLKDESILFPGSHCVNCNHKLSWYELIPVFSYLFLKGKCRKCKTHISIQYPLIEILTGLLFDLSFLSFGFSYKTLIAIVISSIVIITFITDFKEMVILDQVTVVGIVLVFLIKGFFVSWKVALGSLLYGLALFLILLLIKIIGDKVFKTESLGWGDVKISFFAGCVLGIYLGIFYLFLGAFLALPFAIISSYKSKNNIIPFGPFLVLSMYIIYCNMDNILYLINLWLGVSI